MRKKNILITGVGGDIGVSIIKCLKDTGYQMDLTGCDIDPYSAGKAQVSRFFVVPEPAQRDRYYKSIRDIVNKYKIKYIFPSTEPEIKFFDKNRTYFLKKEVKIFINRPFILNTFFDKYKTINFLKKNNLPHPKTFLIENFNKQLKYPLIIKPRKGYGSKQLIRINKPNEFSLYKNMVCNAIVQEEVGNENEEYTTGVFSNGVQIYTITFRRKLGFGSLSRVVELVRNHEVSALAEKLARCVDLVGSINIQTRKTRSGFVVIEVNPRLSSTVYFRHYFGFQDVKWWLQLADGQRAIKFKLKYKKGVGVRSLDEVFYALK
ncbi:MAG: ATP-grasp domain-containing protein [Candidatus Omnitrophica bacterium]|nr:ATP-grasp domain-containing protein [Candidatus Omnitrophota bacterium]